MTNFSVWVSLGGAAIIDFGIQWVMWIVSVILVTEYFYDITSATTYFLLTMLSLLLPDGTPTARQIVVSTFALIWSVRLGGFLLYRVIKAKGDKRFDEAKKQPLKFWVYWTVQAVWIWVTISPVIILNSIPRNRADKGFIWSDYLGWVIWIIGFSCETLSDLQKIWWRSPETKGKWIDVGLWKYSRHPNYFGEILCWVGIFVASAAVYNDAEFIGVISPIFITILLCFVSGIPILEKGADEKWGSNERYQQYKHDTSILVPLPVGWNICGL